MFCCGSILLGDLLELVMYAAPYYNRERPEMKMLMKNGLEMKKTMFKRGGKKQKTYKF